MGSSPTAILIFSVSASAEAARKAKTFREKPGVARRIADALIANTLREARLSGLPVVMIPEGQQRGATFGERLTHAFQSTFRLGYQRVMAIGNDCPSLTAANLRQAALALESNGLVIGPASDGGAYLIGMDRTCFDPVRLSALAWQESHLCRDLIHYSAAFRRGVTLLQQLDDIDDRRALLAIARSCRKEKLCRHILNLIGKTPDPPVRDDVPCTSPFVTLCANLRSPPLPLPAFC